MDQLDRIGRFETVKLLGRGGMGEVYLARDPLIDRLVAVKLLSAAFDEVARDRFTREARAAGRLAHEHIVTVFDVGEHRGQPFIAMEYVPGDTLGALIRGRPSPPRGELLRLIQDACTGLAFAHRSGVVHLDVKPENLLRRQDGRLKILDFGLARVVAIDETHTRHSAGTLRYMSPEQLNGGLVDHRSDVFGLGCVLYEALTGQPAFGSTWPDVLARLSAGWVPRPSAVVASLHPSLERMTMRALAIDPGERYQDLAALAAELGALRRELEVEGGADTDSFSGPVLAPMTAERTEAMAAADTLADVPESRSLAPASSRVPVIAVAAAPPTRQRSHRVWIAAAAVAAMAAAGLWVWRGAGPRAAIELAAPLAPTASPDAVPPEVIARQGVEAAAASAFTADVWQAVARRDHVAAARLLRGQPGLTSPLLGELAAAARTAAADARRAADARGRAVQDTAEYRAGLDALAQARRGDAAGPTLDGLTATWAAIDAFERATPQVAAAPRPTATPVLASPSDIRAGAAEAAPGPGSPDPPGPPPAARDAAIRGPAPGVVQPDPPRPPVATAPAEAGAVPERAAEPPTPLPAAPASPRAPTAEESVRAALAAYEAAYDAHDVAALRQVFPRLSADQAQALTRTFADAVSYRLDLRVLDVTVDAATAAATCVVTHALVPKVGSPSRTTQTSTFELAPSGNAWVITRIVPRR